MGVAFIGIGSNLGPREAVIARALGHLRAAHGIETVACSRLYETQPVGGPAGQPMFLNSAARVETTLAAEELLDVLLSIEVELGRERGERWGPRTIDLDLLLYEDRVVQTPKLMLPHPRLHERRFVLEPLAEIAPDVVHPVLGRTIQTLLRELDRG